MIKKIKKASILEFWIYSIIITLGIVLSMGFILDNTVGDISKENPIDRLPRVFIIFLAVFFAPLLETLIYQYLPYKIFNYWKIVKKEPLKNSLIFLVSSFTFGLSHPYSVAYFIYALLVGFVFMGIFFISYEIRKDGNSSFWLVVLIHSLINLLAVLGV